MTINSLYKVIKSKKETYLVNSYTSSLLNGDIKRIAQKVGEEGIEVAIAASISNQNQTIYEIADLWFHSLVLMNKMNISIKDIENELEARNIKTEKFLIAGGNSTLLVQDCPQVKRELIIKKNLGNVEQIGFVGGNSLEMMGNELCINSTLAFASILGNQGKLKTSGLSKNVAFKNTSNKTSITFNMDFIKDRNIILFEGIGFVVNNKKMKDLKKTLMNYCNKYNLPAFGLIELNENKITPYVFVKGTESLFKETACGSGSIAASLYSGFNNIIQPTGEIIKVSNKGNKFTVQAKVVKMKE